MQKVEIGALCGGRDVEAAAPARGSCGREGAYSSAVTDPRGAYPCCSTAMLDFFFHGNTLDLFTALLYNGIDR